MQSILRIDPGSMFSYPGPSARPAGISLPQTVGLSSIACGPDGKCFLEAWAVSKSVHWFQNDGPKPNLPKRKGIHPFRCSVWVC